MRSLGLIVAVLCLSVPVSADESLFAGDLTLLRERAQFSWGAGLMFSLEKKSSSGGWNFRVSPGGQFVVFNADGRVISVNPQVSFVLSQNGSLERTEVDFWPKLNIRRFSMDMRPIIVFDHKEEAWIIDPFSLLPKINDLDLSRIPSLTEDVRLILNVIPAAPDLSSMLTHEDQGERCLPLFQCGLIDWKNGLPYVNEWVHVFQRTHLKEPIKPGGKQR